MEKAYQLSEKIINDINEYSQKYIGEEGKYVNTPDSIELLNCIIEEGFTLHKYMCEKELYVEKPRITKALLKVQKYIEKLTITEENAKKLNISNALQIWEQARIAIAFLACEILDFRDTLN